MERIGGLLKRLQHQVVQSELRLEGEREQWLRAVRRWLGAVQEVQDDGPLPQR